MNAISPPSQTTDLAALCAELVPGGATLSLPRVAPLDARPVDCFEVVERRVVERGGTACFGWMLREWRGFYLEAEFYSVWRDVEGRLYDITPRLEAGPILFLTDPTRIFEGRRVKPVRRALSGDPAVTGFLRVCDEEFALMTRGARAFMRNVSLQGSELGELQLIWQRKTAFLQRIALLEAAGGA
jgi:hypothetical protein